MAHPRSRQGWGTDAYQLTGNFLLPDFATSFILLEFLVSCGLLYH
jgi:hypothetical protein